MSEAALSKIQKDCAKLENELAIYKNSQSLSTSCESIITFVNSQPDSFVVGGAPKEANPWVASGGGGGGCAIS